MGANLFNWGGQAEIEVIFSIEGTPSADCRVEVLTSPRLIYRGQGLTPSRANDSPWQIKMHMCRLWRWIKTQNLQGKARQGRQAIEFLKYCSRGTWSACQDSKEKCQWFFSVCVDNDASLQYKILLTTVDERTHSTYKSGPLSPTKWDVFWSKRVIADFCFGSVVSKSNEDKVSITFWNVSSEV